LLDDYATEIILETSRICFVPNEVLEQGDDDERAIFTALYPGGEPEIIAEHLDGMTALFSLADGLDGFISRTLPGARIRSHLGVLTSRFAKMHTQGRNIYADMRDAEVDIVAFDGSRLISASTQPWRHPDDVVYRIFNLLNAYDIDPADASIHISGTHEDRHTVVKTLRQLTSDASFTTLPPCATPLPLAMLLQAFRNG
ncbi:MAG: DUF3822 family protein, partial [Muribaculaceae bacterium]|nr:DUF3822 family protein [Muribaculaceae bacterium]